MVSYSNQPTTLLFRYYVLCGSAACRFYVANSVGNDSFLYVRSMWLVVLEMTSIGKSPTPKWDATLHVQKDGCPTLDFCSVYISTNKKTELPLAFKGQIMFEDMVHRVSFAIETHWYRFLML